MMNVTPGLGIHSQRRLCQKAVQRSSSKGNFEIAKIFKVQGRNRPDLQTRDGQAEWKLSLDLPNRPALSTFNLSITL